MAKKPDLSQTKPCLSCGVPVLWAVTESGSRMPLEQIEGTHFIVEPGELGQLRCRAVPVYVSHFANCPDADRWRGRSRSGGES